MVKHLLTYAQGARGKDDTFSETLVKNESRPCDRLFLCLSGFLPITLHKIWTETKVKVFNPGHVGGSEVVEDEWWEERFRGRVKWVQVTVWVCLPGGFCWRLVFLSSPSFSTSGTRIAPKWMNKQFGGSADVVYYPGYCPVSFLREECKYKNPLPCL